MFGQNKTATPHAFDLTPEGSLVVTSIFPTLQGEGPFAGHPAIFIRLAYCNLTCTFCDTYFDSGDEMTFAEINAAIVEARKAFPSASRYRQPMLVITGGEPLMQRNLNAFLATRGVQEVVQIETNGNFYQRFPWWVEIVISPKINERTGQYVKVVLLENAHFLKFVVSADMPGYTTIPDWALAWRDASQAHRIYVSPMNCYKEKPAMPTSASAAKERAALERISFWQPGLLDLEANRRNHEYAAELAMKFNCILTLQQHLYTNLP